MKPFKLPTIYPLLVLLLMMTGCNMKQSSHSKDTQRDDMPETTKNIDISTLEPTVGMDVSSIKDTATLNRFAKIYYENHYFHDAVKCLQISANQGDAWAQYDLGCCYSDGKGVNEDPKLAFKYLKLAADQGYAPAISAICEAYRSGDGVTQDVEKHLEYLHQLSDMGYFHGHATYRLGIHYKNKDNKKAIHYYRLASEQGNRFAASKLGEIYGKGLLGVQKNSRLAVQYHERAVTLGGTLYALVLGRLYEHGKDGVPKNIKRAMELYLQGGQKGDGDCYYELGKIYYKGHEVLRDRKKGLMYLKKADTLYSYSAFKMLRGLGVKTKHLEVDFYHHQPPTIGN